MKDPATFWQPMRDEATGIVSPDVCLVNDPEACGYFCLMLGCEPCEMGYVRFTFTNGDLPSRVVAGLCNFASVLIREEFDRPAPTSDHK